MKIEWRLLLLTAGLLFVAVGLAIIDSENPSYASMIQPLYQFILIIFYLVLVISLISLLLASFDFIKKNLKGNSPKAV